MSVSHFFKHLPYTLSRHLIHKPLHSPFPLLRPLFRSRTRTHSSSKKHTYPITQHHSFFTIKSSIPSSFSYATQSEPSTSKYLSVRIHCPRDVSDTLSEALLSFGASSVSVDEEESFNDSNEIFIDSIFLIDEEVGMCISRAADSIGLKDVPKYEVNIGDESVWIKKTQESFFPVEVTEGLWIVPEWQNPPDVQATNIILDPGLAFGTGEHATTKLCLLLLKRLITGGERFLDYGTGSGILAIAAQKFGAALSVGVDIDPRAIASAHRNSSLNNIRPEELELYVVPDESLTSSMFVKDNFDVVIANILLNPLLELADDIVSYAKPGAVVGISGILSEQLPHIIDRYSDLLDGISVSEIDDWACVSGIKKAVLT